MNVHPRSVRLAAPLVVVLLAGCTTATPTASPTSVATTNPTTDPTTNPTPAPTTPDLRISDGAVPAGRYRLLGYEPPITVGLDGSWQSLAQQRGYASLTQVSRPAGSNPYRAGTLIQIALVQGVVAAGDTSIKPASAAEAVDAITEGLGELVVEASDSRIGGLDGEQVTVERPGDGPPMSMNVISVLSIPPGAIVLTPGARLWIACFDTAQGVVAVVINGSIKDWDAELAAAEPVLEQIRFEVP